MIVKDVVDVIVAACKVPPPRNSCDTLVAGSLDDEVSGVVTTFMATVEVVRKTIAAGANLIITHEPTFFTGFDTLDWLSNDEVYSKKRKMIDENRINIWRFHDGMHMHEPDLIYRGLVKELGWEDFVDRENHHCFDIPAICVADLAHYLRGRLDVKTLRIVGNPDEIVERLAILVGGGSLGLGREEMPMELMRRAGLDVIVCGEILEWTLCAYVRDAAQLGMNRSLIILGHNRSEEAGMKHLPAWLQPLLPGIPITFIEAGEPFDGL